MNAISSTIVPPTSARRMLLLLAAVFFLPFAVGTGLFWSGWRPEKFANHGELLQPPRILPDGGLHHPDGNPLPTSELHGKWLLVMSNSEPCRVVCQQDLQQMLQVHMALNKEQSRVQRVFISSDVSARDSASSLAEAQSRFPDLVVGLWDSGAAKKTWQGILESSGRELYVVDPLGNVILRYAAPPDMRGVLKDLERLLKYSWLR